MAEFPTGGIIPGPCLFTWPDGCSRLRPEQAATIPDYVGGEDGPVYGHITVIIPGLADHRADAPVIRMASPQFEEET